MNGRYRLVGTSPYVGRPVALGSRKTLEEIEQRQRWYERLGYTNCYVIPPKGAACA